MKATKKITTLQLSIDAMLCAICAVLGYLAIDLTSIKVTFEELPILVAALIFGPVDGVMVGAIGTLIYQLIRYGITATTFLWMLPYIIFALIIGLYSKKFNFKIPRIKLTVLIISCELLVTLLNTGVIYIDSKIYGWYYPTLITGSLLIRIIVCLVKGSFFSVILYELIRAIKKGAPGVFSVRSGVSDLKMTPADAIAYIESYTWSKTRLGLERTRALLEAMGDPQKKLKFIHVTGSNCKGSTCAILDSVLRKQGYTTGLYTSPYICEFSERIKVNGENIGSDDLAGITARVKDIADRMEDHPSQFELVTAIAFEYFLMKKCDIVVLEVGMGGALDSTNVIDCPEVAVFTNIGLEHTEYLGKTIEEIATTKGGIIKPGCSVVCYDSCEASNKILEDISRSLNVPFRLVDFNAIEPVSHDLNGQVFRRKGITYDYPLLGSHQLKNAEVAFETIETLRERGFEISEDAVVKGFADVRWIARFEVLSRNPLFILDGGHNPQCAEAMAEVLKEYLPDRKVTFIMGVLADKDYTKMIGSVSPFASRFVCLTPKSPRALDAQELVKILQNMGYDAVACENAADAIAEAQKTSEPVVAFGSLYMAGAILREFNIAG
ncbi:MAG: ECF transporter S component [Lachnospiraceae bacterium]|nr:ECF transporter S component [Lachnospiraceae bacterium]